MANDVDNTPKRCRLLELPAELRDGIYEYALSYDSVLVDPTKRTDDEPTLADAAALTMTCKQIHKECGNLIYSLNVMQFVLPTGFDQIKAMILQIADKHKAYGMQKNIEIFFASGDRDLMFLNQLHVMRTGLRRLSSAGVNIFVEARPFIRALNNVVLLRFRVDDIKQTWPEWFKNVECGHEAFNLNAEGRQRLLNFMQSIFEALWDDEQFLREVADLEYV